MCLQGNPVDAVKDIFDIVVAEGKYYRNFLQFELQQGLLAIWVAPKLVVFRVAAIVHLFLRALTESE